MSAAGSLLSDGPEDATQTLILAHGAGAPMDSPFMAFFAEQLASRGIRVVRFEFPYMVARRATGKKKPPDRADKLLECWREVIGQTNTRYRSTENLFIGGKSMGGRMATMVAAQQQEAQQQATGESVAVQIAGVICLGYPFHPPGKPDNLRIEHLADLSTPLLIVQGARDPFGKPDEVVKYRLSSTAQTAWIPDGDHSLKPTKRSGRTSEQNWDEAACAVAQFLSDVAE